METELKQIAELIVGVAREEDLILRRVGKGIFLMPESAFVYAVGRALALSAKKIFDTPEVEWCPETTFEDVGRVDLVFKVNGGKLFAFEFKRAGSGEAYADDIRKLARLDRASCHALFVGLIEAWPESIKDDPRIRAVEHVEGVTVERITSSGKGFDFFATESHYKNQVCCVVGIWRVKPTV